MTFSDIAKGHVVRNVAEEHKVRRRCDLSSSLAALGAVPLSREETDGQKLQIVAESEKHSSRTSEGAGWVTHVLAERSAPLESRFCPRHIARSGPVTSPPFPPPPSKRTRGLGSSMFYKVRARERGRVESHARNRLAAFGKVREQDGLDRGHDFGSKICWSPDDTGTCIKAGGRLLSLWRIPFPAHCAQHAEPASSSNQSRSRGDAAEQGVK